MERLGCQSPWFNPLIHCFYSITFQWPPLSPPIRRMRPSLFSFLIFSSMPRVDNPTASAICFVVMYGSCFINLHTFSTLFSTFFSTFFSVVFLWNVTLTPPQKFSTTGIGNIFHILALPCLHLAHISLQSYTFFGFLNYYSMQNQ